MLVATRATATFESAEGPVIVRSLATFDEGRLYELHLPAGVERVHVVIAPADAGAEERDKWEQRVEASFVAREEKIPAWLVEVRARTEKEEDASLAAYRDHARAEDDAEAALGAGGAARIELWRGHLDESVALFRQAIARDRVAGRISDAVDDSLALAFALGERSHRSVEARAALDGIGDLLSRYPDGRARDPYYRALLDCETGNRRAAIARFEEAQHRAEELGLARVVRTVRSAVATELDLVGRFDEALAIRRALDAAPDLTPCDRFVARTGEGFGLLLMAIRENSDRGRVREAREVLERARAEAACDESYLHAVAAGNLAFAALLEGRPEDAARDLAEARRAVPEPPLSESFFWLDLDGRVALARRQPARALAIYDEMEQRAGAALLPEHEWSALVGRGAAYEQLGRVSDALAAYERAEEKLDDASLSIPIGEGRARFLVEREARGDGRDRDPREAGRWCRSVPMGAPVEAARPRGAGSGAPADVPRRHRRRARESLRGRGEGALRARASRDRRGGRARLEAARVRPRAREGAEESARGRAPERARRAAERVRPRAAVDDGGAGSVRGPGELLPLVPSCGGRLARNERRSRAGSWSSTFRRSTREGTLPSSRVSSSRRRARRSTVRPGCVSSCPADSPR